MTKGKKKTNRRLKKTVRKTLGTLFLISAIVVAAIPTEGLRAADGTEKEVTESYLQQMSIPYLDSKEEIYTTGDGKYQFAYVTDGGSDKGAVILGYNGGYLEGNNLVIPDGLDAYKKYSYSDGTNGGYVAVGKENDFLFYAVNQTTTDPETGAEIVISTSYQPCRYEDRAQWENLSSEELYYHKSILYPVVILYLFMRKRQIPINSVSKVQRYGILATSICRKEPEKMQVPGKLQDRSPVVIRGFLPEMVIFTH